MTKHTIRPADKNDIQALLEIEQQCFSGDRLSKRSFNHFIKGQHSCLAVLEHQQQIIGYSVLLFRTGTHLARIYSLAVLPQYRGQGYAQALLNWCEHKARQRKCIFLRLEVSQNNQAAIGLYQKLGYQTIGRLKSYYQDGSDGWRLEKRLLPKAAKSSEYSFYKFYAQTTEFTCGPSCLMMALNQLLPCYNMNRSEELAIWREATTVFMTAGHGGCSPHGLALSAFKRGLTVNLIVSSSGTPFIDGVRQADKKDVIELIHAEFLQQLQQTTVQIINQWPTEEELENILAQQQPILALISTWHLNRNKAPHWVLITSSDKEYIYINDPDLDLNQPHQSLNDYQQIPIAKPLFWKMARFGKQKLKALLQLSVASHE